MRLTHLSDMTKQIATDQDLQFNSPVIYPLVAGALELLLGLSVGIAVSYPVLVIGFSLSSPSSYLRLFSLFALPIGLLIDGIIRLLRCVPAGQSRVTIETDQVAIYPGLNLPARRLSFRQIGYGLCYQSKGRWTGYVQLFYYPIQIDDQLNTSRLLRTNLPHTTRDGQLLIEIGKRATGPKPEFEQMRAYFGWRPLLKIVVGWLALLFGLEQFPI